MTRPDQGPSRRDVLRFAVAGAGSLAISPFVRGAPLRTAHRTSRGTTRRFVVINCYGGFDGLNMLVPLGLQAYYDRRPGLAIAAADTLSLNGTQQYGLHPSLVNLRSIYNQDGALAIVRKVGYPDANLSHFKSQDIFSLGVRGDFPALGIPESGWIARFASTYAPAPLETVSVGTGRKLDLVGPGASPLLVKKLQDFDFKVDGRYRNNHRLRRDMITGILQDFAGSGPGLEASTTLQQSEQFTAWIQSAVDGYTAPPGVTWPSSTPGRYLRDIAVLIHAGAPTRVFFTGFGGWDTHGNQGGTTGRHADLLTRLDEGLGAFVADLKATGAWNDTVILVMSEFGRRNFENGSGGTDHGHGNMFFALGGPVQGGLYGPDLTNFEIEQNRQLGYDVDFRDIYREVLDRHLQVNPAPIFPETQEISTTLGFLP